MSCEKSNKIVFDFLSQEGNISAINSLNDREAYAFTLGSLAQNNIVYKTQILDNVFKYSPRGAKDIINQIDNNASLNILGKSNKDIVDAIEYRGMHDYAIAKSLGLDKFSELNLLLREGDAFSKTDWETAIKANEKEYNSLRTIGKEVGLNDYLVGSRILSRFDRADTLAKISKYIEDGSKTYSEITPILPKEDFVKTVSAKKEVEAKLKEDAKKIKVLEGNLAENRTKDGYLFSDQKGEEVVYKTTTEQDGAIETTSETAKLYDEAKKYKTADEFIKEDIEYKKLSEKKLNENNAKLVEISKKKDEIRKSGGNAFEQNKKISSEGLSEEERIITNENKILKARLKEKSYNEILDVFESDLRNFDNRHFKKTNPPLLSGTGVLMTEDGRVVLSAGSSQGEVSILLARSGVKNLEAIQSAPKLMKDFYTIQKNAIDNLRGKYGLKNGSQMTIDMHKEYVDGIQSKLRKAREDANSQPKSKLDTPPIEQIKVTSDAESVEGEKVKYILSEEQSGQVKRQKLFLRKVRESKTVNVKSKEKDVINEIYGSNTDLYNSDKKFFDSYNSTIKEAKGKDVDFTNIEDVNKSRQELLDAQTKLQKDLNNKDVLIAKKEEELYQAYKDEYESNANNIYNAINNLNSVEDVKSFVFANIAEYKNNKELIEYTQGRIENLIGGDFGITQTFKNLDKFNAGKDVKVVRDEMVRNRLIASGKNVKEAGFSKQLDTFFKTGKTPKGITADDMYKAIGLEEMVNSNASYNVMKGKAPEIAIYDFVKSVRASDLETAIKEAPLAEVFNIYKPRDFVESDNIGQQMMHHMTNVDIQGKTLYYIKKPVASQETQALQKLKQSEFLNGSIFISKNIKEVQADELEGILNSNPDALIVLENKADLYVLPNSVKYNKGKARYVVMGDTYKDTSFIVNDGKLYAGTINNNIKKDWNRKIRSLGGKLTSDKSYAEQLEKWLYTMNENDMSVIKSTLASITPKEQKVFIRKLLGTESINTLEMPVDYDNLPILTRDELNNYVSRYIGINVPDSISDVQLLQAYNRWKYDGQSSSQFARDVGITTVQEENKYNIVATLTNDLFNARVEVPTQAMREFAKDGNVKKLINAIEKKNTGNATDIEKIVQDSLNKPREYNTKPLEGKRIGRVFIEPDNSSVLVETKLNNVEDVVNAFNEISEKYKNKFLETGNDHFALAQTKVKYQQELDMLSDRMNGGYTDSPLILTYDAIKINNKDDVGVFDYYKEQTKDKIRNYFNLMTENPTFASHGYENRGGVKWTIQNQIDKELEGAIVVPRGSIDTSKMTLKQKNNVLEGIRAIENIYRKRVGDRVYAYSQIPGMQDFFDNYALVETDAGLLPKIMLESNISGLPYEKDWINKNNILQEVSKNIETLTPGALDEILTKVVPGKEDVYRDVFLPYTNMFDLPGLEFPKYDINKDVYESVKNLVVSTPTGNMTVEQMLKSSPAGDLPSFLIGPNKLRKTETFVDGKDVFNPALFKAKMLQQEDVILSATTGVLTRKRNILENAKELQWLSTKITSTNKLSGDAANSISVLEKIRSGGRGNYKDVQAVIEQARKYQNMSDVKFNEVVVEGNEIKAIARDIVAYEKSWNRTLTEQGIAPLDIISRIEKIAKGGKETFDGVENSVKQSRMFELIPGTSNMTVDSFREMFSVPNMPDSQIRDIISGLKAPSYFFGRITPYINFLSRIPSLFSGIFNGYQMIQQSVQYEVKIEAVKKLMGITKNDLDKVASIMKQLGVEQDVGAAPGQILNERGFNYRKMKEFVSAVALNANNITDNIYLGKLSNLYFVEGIRNVGGMTSVDDFIRVMNDASIPQTEKDKLIEGIDVYMTRALRQDAGIYRSGIDEIQTEGLPGIVNRLFEATAMINGFRGGWGNQRMIDAAQNIYKLFKVVGHTIQGRRGVAEAIYNDPDLTRFIYNKIYTAYIATKYAKVIRNDDDTQDNRIDDIIRVYKAIDQDVSAYNSAGYFRIANGVFDRTRQAGEFSRSFIMDAFLKSAFSGVNPTSFVNVYKRVEGGQHIVDAILDEAMSSGARGLAYNMGDASDRLNSAYSEPLTPFEILMSQSPNTATSELEKKLRSLRVIDDYKKGLTEGDVLDKLKFLMKQQRLLGFIINTSDFGISADVKQSAFNDEYDRSIVGQGIKNGELDMSGATPLQQQKIISGIAKDGFGGGLGGFDINDTSVEGGSLKMMKDYLLAYPTDVNNLKENTLKAVPNKYFRDFLLSIPKEDVEKYVARLDATTTRGQRINEEFAILSENRNNPYAGTLIVFANMNQEYQTIQATRKAEIKKLNKATSKADDIIFDANGVKEELVRKYLPEIINSNKAVLKDLGGEVFTYELINKGALKDILKTSDKGDVYLTNQGKQYFNALADVYTIWNAGNQKARPMTFNKVAIAAGKLSPERQVGLYSELNKYVEDNSELDKVEKMDLKISIMNRMSSVVGNIEEARLKFGNTAVDTYIDDHFATLGEVDNYLQTLKESVDESLSDAKTSGSGRGGGGGKGIGRLPSIDYKKLQLDSAEKYAGLQSYKGTSIKPILQTKGNYLTVPNIRENFSTSGGIVGKATSRVYFAENKQSTGQKNMTFKRTTPKIIKALSLASKK